MNPNDLAAMLEMMAQGLRHLPDGAGPAVVAGPPQRTLDEWLDVHERQIRERGYKPATVTNRLSNLKHVRRLWGARPIRAIKPHEITSAIRAEFLPSRSSTAQRVLGELRDAYSEAIANDWAESNPAAHAKMPAHRVKRKRLTLDTWQRMRTLSRALPAWVEAMLLLALVTGQRRADLAKMRFDDVVDGCLRVEQQKQAGKGYGARVAIPLTLRLDAVGLTVGEVVEFCRTIGKPGPTLLRKAGGGAIELSSLSARFSECIRAVLGDGAHADDEWPSLHEVRSLSARLYTAQGVDVQVLLGHKHSEMTDLYRDDRGLSAKEWKRVESAPT